MFDMSGNSLSRRGLLGTFFAGWYRSDQWAVVLRNGDFEKGIIPFEENPSKVYDRRIFRKQISQPGQAIDQVQG